MDKKVDEKQIIARYAKIMSTPKGYEGKELTILYHEIKAGLIEYLLHKNGINKNENILEVGVGTGLTATPLSLRGYYITGFDLSPHMLQKAVKRKEHNHLKNLHLLRASGFNNLPFSDNSFKGVYAIQVLHLFEMKERQALLREMRRVLVDGGIIIGDFLQRSSHLLKWMRTCSTRSRRYETVRGIRESLSLFPHVELYSGILPYIWRFLCNTPPLKSARLFQILSLFPLVRLFSHSIFAVVTKD